MISGRVQGRMARKYDTAVVEVGAEFMMLVTPGHGVRFNALLA